MDVQCVVCVRAHMHQAERLCSVSVHVHAFDICVLDHEGILCSSVLSVLNVMFFIFNLPCICFCIHFYNMPYSYVINLTLSVLSHVFGVQ